MLDRCLKAAAGQDKLLDDLRVLRYNPTLLLTNAGYPKGEVPKWLRERSAKPLCRGSNPLLASTLN
jgi:hypothetical protein